MSRIALLIPDLEAGGAERVMLMLAREFHARGHSVDLLVVFPQGRLRAMVPAGVRLTVLFDTPFRRIGKNGLALAAIWRLAVWLRRNRPDALMSTVTGANFTAIVARELAARPLRLVIREATPLNNVSSRFRLWLMRRLYPRADAVIALTGVMERQLRDRIGIDGGRIHRVPNPVDTDFIRMMAAKPVTHPKLQRAGGDKIVVTIGRLVPLKDHVTLILAMSRVVENCQARLFIVGDGPERPRLEALADRLSLRERVIFTGFDMNPWRWLAHADLFVLPSRWEGYPNALLEALTLGVPSVVTEYDASVLEMAKEYGFATVPVGDPERISEEIASSLARDKKRDVPRLENDLEIIVDSYLSVLLPPPGVLSRLTEH
jgi:glycosyltransferase involved in cell wall biosynthesis